MKKILIILLGVLFSCFYSQNLTDTENYIYKKTHLSDPSDPVQKQSESVQYLDGLGRPKQVISVKATPSGQDMVVPIVYDQFGRKTKNYLPIPAQTSNAGIQTSVTESTVNTYYGVTNAFSEKDLELSPLSRIFESANPGEEWKMSAGHTVKYEYDANSTDDQVKKYEVTTIWDNINQIYASAPSQVSYYDENLLYKYSIRDEDHNEKIIFKDPYGHIVLIRKNDGAHNLDTYYVYDKYDHLTYVIPPLAAAAAFTQNTLDNLCYQYRYDNKRRVVEKKLPGKGLELLVYDKQNRLVLSQDAVLRSTDNTFTKRGWLFTKYDPLGRVVYHGFFTNTASRNVMQTALNNMSANAWNNEARSITPFTLDGMEVYYTKNAFPTGSMVILGINYYDTYPPLPAGVTMPAYIINPQQAILSQDAQSSSRSTKGFPTASYVKNIEDNNWTKNFMWYDTKGRSVSGHTVNHLGGYTKIESLLDFAGMPQRVNTYHLRKPGDVGVTLSEGFIYDSQNRLLQHYHKVDDKLEILLADHTYNELSQLSNKKVGWSQGIPLQSIDYAYNIRGWLTDINKDQMTLPDLGGKLFSYKIKYTQKEGISNPGTLLFAGKNVIPKYNGNIAEVDWRAAEALGNNPTLAPKRYGYSYDGINRLKAGYYQNPYNPSSRENTESVDYDLNGNITRLYRTSVTENGNIPTVIDNLEYFYDNGNNQLTRVDDHAQNLSGYEGGGNTIGYDANGNMQNLADKGIGNIKYNYLDLPNNINLQRNNIENVNIDTKYNADGIKLSKTNTTIITGFVGFTTTKSVTDYLDGFQYFKTESIGNPAFPGNPGGGGSESLMANSETSHALERQAFSRYSPSDPVVLEPLALQNPDLQFFPTAEGFYDYKKNQYIYHYQDQIGNIRLSYGRNPGTGLMEIVDQNDYYPFGMNHLKTGNAMFGAATYKNYKYQEQELQETGFYSFKWRNYMPDLGRFFNIDPLSEVYAYQSHYNFSENRVTDAREIEGLEAELLNESSSESSTSGASFDGQGYDGGLSSLTTWSDGVKGANIQNIDLGTFKASSGQSSNFTWGDAGRIGVGFVPIVGSGLDIYEGVRDGNWVQFGIGIGGLALDVATLGTGSILKGGVKAIGTELVEGGLEMAAKETIELEAKQSLKTLSKTEMNIITGSGSDANVLRGGTCLACQFENGSGVIVDSNGLLSGVSVNSAEGLSIKELSTGIPNGKIGTTTMSQIKKLGGKVEPKPTKNNPFHSILSGITAKQAEKLFNPVIKNPTK